MKKNHEIFNYVLFGILTTIINIVVYYYFIHFIENDYILATSIAWFLSVLFAYITNKIFVFKTKSKNYKYLFQEIFNFIFFRAASYFLDIIMMIILIELLYFNVLYSKIIVNIVVIVSNYLISKLFIFKKTKVHLEELKK
jgi:putative flippase GtrA